MAKKNIKHRYLESLGVFVLILSLIRCMHPEIAGTSSVNNKRDNIVSPKTNEPAAIVATISREKEPTKTAQPQEVATRYLPDGGKPHRIYSVQSYQEAFPDTNALQLTAAQQWGVIPVANRADAEHRKRELVYINSNPYYHVDQLHASIPYLVPRAAILLEDIGRAFFDSLQVKGIPLHRFIVTSVLRSQEDVRKLRNYNKNATEQSCHLYGTTFDICYNRYKTVKDPNGEYRRSVSNDTLKWVLSEVLRDMRQQQRCYIKYEVKQGCYHMTVR